MAFDFRATVEDQLKKRGHAKAWLAEKLGVSRQSLQIMLDRNKPTVQTVLKICEIFGLELQIVQKPQA